MTDFIRIYEEPNVAQFRSILLEIRRQCLFCKIYINKNVEKRLKTPKMSFNYALILLIKIIMFDPKPGYSAVCFLRIWWVSNNLLDVLFNQYNWLII